MTLVILNGSCKDINPHSLYMINTRDDSLKYIKRYSCEFFEEITIQENSYVFYRRRNNSSSYDIPP